MENRIKIRKATKKDFSKIAEIWKKEYSKKPYNEKWKIKDIFAKIKDYLKESKIYVATLDKKIVGFIIFKRIIWDDGKHLFIDEVVVSKKFQGKGIGKVLMSKAEKESKGCVLVELWTYKEAEACNFYKKLGYKEIKDGVMMHKKIK
jgi:ribosomal protein S18 acetylase RimI-like enzyme